MTTRPKQKKSEAMRFLERISGGPLTLAEVLKTLRDSEDMTQQEFAKAMGISKQNLCDIEKGRKFVSASRAAIFAKKLGYPPTFFIQLALQEELDRAGVRLKVTVGAA